MVSKNVLCVFPPPSYSASLPITPAVEIARAQFLCFPETWQTCSASFRRSEESLVRKGKPWVQAYPSHVSCSWLIEIISFSKVHFPMSWDSPAPCTEDPSLSLCSGSLTPSGQRGQGRGEGIALRWGSRSADPVTHSCGHSQVRD